MRKQWLCLTLCAASFCPLQAQDADSLLLGIPDSLLTYSDSLSIFNLIDSLLTLEEVSPRSAMAVRLSYNSNVQYAGRTLGIDQFGLTPGLSYYHKSGLYADVSAFWSDEFEPNFYLTILSAGYMHSFSKKFGFAAYYDKYFYKLDDTYIPYTNGITISPMFDFKLVTFQLDYTFYFGEEYANRIMPSFALNLEKRKLWGIDRVSFSPGFYILWGDQSFTNILIPSTRDEWIEALKRLNQGKTWYNTETFREFGIMNYSISVPLTVQCNDFNFTVSYVYSIPKALPSETLTLSESGFLSAGISYYINFGKTKYGF